MSTNNLKKEGDINLSSKRKQWQESQLDTSALNTLEQDASCFIHQAMSTPCLAPLEAAEGIYLHDSQGRKYMDFHGNNVHQIGFSHPHVVSKLKSQLDQLAFSTRRYTNQTAIDCAQKLTALTPGDLNRVLFAPGGTSVVGMALKLARIVSGKQKVISLWDSFHGASMDAISVGGTRSFNKGLGPLMPGVEHIPPPTTYRGVFTKDGEDDSAYTDYLEYVLQNDPDIAVFIAETVRNTDAQFPSKAYWKRVRELCDHYGVLLILDEIPIALGRTGYMFAFEHYDIAPDFLCLGKGLGGGIIPFAAMITRDKFNIAEDVSLGHYTHEKSPLGSAAALATLEVIEKEDLLQKAKKDGLWLQKELTTLQQKYPLIGDVRGRGLLWGIELVKDQLSKERAIEEAEIVMYACLSAGLSFKVSQGNVLQLSPPLIITQQQLQEAMTILDQALYKASTQLRYPINQ